MRDLKERYERRGVSNKELKDRLTTVLNEHGTKRNRVIATATMEMVRDALDLNYLRKY